MPQCRDYYSPFQVKAFIDKLYSWSPKLLTKFIILCQGFWEIIFNPWASNFTMGVFLLTVDGPKVQKAQHLVILTFRPHGNRSTIQGNYLYRGKHIDLQICPITKFRHVIVNIVFPFVSYFKCWVIAALTLSYF